MITGEYYLQDVREMASGFLLKDDGQFQFFFTYGALDRFGAGNWTATNDQVIFQSVGEPLPGFVLKSSRKIEGEDILVKVETANPVFNRYIFCSLQKGEEGSWRELNSHGQLQFPAQPFNTVSLLLEFCPERIATIPVEYPDHNEFVFRLEPAIMDVHFSQFKLVNYNGLLMGGHPLMEGKEFRYVKQ